VLRTEPILLIENDPKNTKNIMSAFEAMEVKSPLVHLNDSKGALNYLRNKNNKKPWLIFLGLNTQSLDGLNFLKIIKSDDNLRIIPIVIIADSDEDRNIVKGFELGIAGYIVKPQDTSKIPNIIRTIMEYWTLSELPPKGG